jgi:hypothetical protein
LSKQIKPSIFINQIKLENMKIIFTLLTSTILIGFSSISQTYNISPNDTVFKFVEVNNYATAEILLPHSNSTSNPVTLKWDVVSVDVPFGDNWDYSFCDYTTCYLGTATDGTMTEMLTGEEAFFKVNLIAPTVGWGTFRIAVYDQDTPLLRDTLTFIFNSSTTLSTADIGATNISIYPNPSANKQVNIDNLMPETSISIIDAMGRVVYSKEQAEGNIQLNLNSLNQGKYLIRLTKSNLVYKSSSIIIN